MSVQQQYRSGWADGDDFSNNFISDLGPLLSLFGEQVAKQFMSESVGWADNIIFAMGPLGIITAIVGAIRVGGPRWLKAIIGRARENRAVAEVELMSSTSHEVCELWNGQQIVRIMGSPEVKELIHINGGDEAASVSGSGGTRLYTLEQAIKQKKVVKIKERSHFQGMMRATLRRVLRLIPDAKCPIETPEDPRANTTAKPNAGSGTTSAPNISLNVHNRRGRGELYLVATIGVILQLGVLVYAGFATYHPQLKFQRRGSDVASYAFPLTSVGTLFVVAGMLICSYIIERSTEEESYQVEGTGAHIIWLQKVATVSDQEFDSYAIFAKDARKLITTSRRNNFNDPSDLEEGGDSEFLSCAGTFVSLCGFFAQFIGLRGVHWSVTITQLGVTVTMAVLRAWVRRGLAKRPYVQLLPPTHEIDWLATRIAEGEGELWGETEHTKTPFLRIWDRICLRQAESEQGRDILFWSPQCLHWGILTGEDIDGYEPLTDDKPSGKTKRAHRVMESRRDLGWLTQWPGPASDNATSVAAAIEVVMNTLFKSGDNNVFFWSMNALKDELVAFKIERPPGGKWSADISEIEAALSLWLYAVRENEQATYKNHDSSDKSAWLRSGMASRRQGLRLLGESTEASRRDMKWWMGSGISKVLQLGESSIGVAGAIDGVDSITVESHRIVGYKGQQKTAGHLGQPINSENGLEVRNYSIQQFPEDLSGAPVTNPTPITAPQVFDSRGTQTSLAVVSDAPLGLLFAQDMFSAFMWAVAKTLDQQNIERIMGQATVQQVTDRVTLDNTAWQSFTLQNPVISRVVQGVQRTGLGSVEEIYLSIIPPLSAEGKLPNAVAVVELAREEARKQELAGNWGKAGEISLWAFRTCMTFGPGHPVAVEATIAFTEFLRSISTAAYERANQRRTMETSTDLKKLRLMLAGELKKSADKPVLAKLANIYEVQGRVEGYEEWKPLVPETPIDTSSSDSPFFKHTSLHEAVLGIANCRGQELIVETQYLNTKDILGWTPLHYAARQGDKALVSGLLEAHADPNATDNTGWTPLHYVTWAKGADPAVGRLLLKHGAVVDMQGRDGFAPLHCAARQDNVEMAKILVKSRARLTIHDNTRKTPLHWAAFIGSKEIVGLLLEAGTYLDSPDEYGRTPLHLAASQGHEDVVSVFIEAPDAGEDMKDQDGLTPVHLAARGGQKGVVEVMIGKDGKGGIDSGTVLHMVASRGNAPLVKELLGVGVGIEVRDLYGYTALHTAAYSGHEAVVRVLLEAGAEKEAKYMETSTALYLAASYGYQETVKVLLEAGADIEAKGENGLTALSGAARQGKHEAVKTLLAAAADMEAKDSYGRTALHQAAIRGGHKIVDILLGVGADIEAKDSYGCTALHLATKNEKTLGVLLEAGADKEAKDRNGCTVLHQAAAMGEYRVVDILLKAGADINAKDTYGSTVLHQSTRNRETLEVLLTAGADKEAKDRNGCTALHWAAESGYHTNVKILLLEGVDIAAKDKNECTALHWATCNGDEDTMGVLLEADADKEAKDKNGCTALHWAAWGDYRMTLWRLLEAGVDKEAKDKNGRTALHKAASRDNKAIIEILIGAGVDKEAKDKNGWTALHWAAAKDYEDALDILLRAGADKKARDNDGCTALHQAAEKGQLRMLQVLLREGADMEAMDKNGCTALHWAVDRGEPTTILELLEAGANAQATNKAGSTPLHHAAYYGQVTAVGLLLYFGGDTAAEDQYGTALHYAAYSGHTVIVRILLEAGLDPQIANAAGLTALHYAAYNGHTTTFETLLAGGSKLQAQDKHGTTALYIATTRGYPAAVKAFIGRVTAALHRAACSGDEAAIEKLLEMGADLEGQDKAGLTALHHAVGSGQKAAVKILLDRGADTTTKDQREWTVLRQASWDGHEVVVKMLLQVGADTGPKDRNGWTALHGASYKGLEVVVKILLEAGADTEARNNYGSTALHLASDNGHQAVVRELLAIATDTDAQDGSGQTALHRAADGGHEVVMKLLLEVGADVGARSKDGSTALHLAASNGHEAAVKVLLQAGVDIEQKDNAGWTALQDAVDNGHDEVAKLFLEAGVD